MEMIGTEEDFWSKCCASRWKRQRITTNWKWTQKKERSLLWYRTDDRSVDILAALHALISLRQIPSYRSVLITYDISQHAGVYNPLQTTLFTKTTALKENSKKPWAARQLAPVYHVDCLSSFLMVWGRVPSLPFIEHLTCETSKSSHKGGFEILAGWKHRGFFVMLCM